jgi:hypothetical protein
VSERSGVAASANHAGSNPFGITTTGPLRRSRAQSASCVGDDDHDVGVGEQARLGDGVLGGDGVGTVTARLVDERCVHLEHEHGAVASRGVETLRVAERVALVHDVGPGGESVEVGERAYLDGERPLRGAGRRRGHLVTEGGQAGGDAAEVLGRPLGGAGGDAAVGADLDEPDRPAHETGSAAPIASMR